VHKSFPYIERDVSWLHFNYRVLQEAKDSNNPLFERIKFLAIYSSNLSEFFAVRVAQHRNLVRISKKTKKELDIHPRVVLKEILDLVKKQQIEFNEIFENQIVPELDKHNIRMLRRLDMSREQREFVDHYFQQNMLPYVQPVLLLKDKVRPFLVNSALYLTVEMREKGKSKSGAQYAIVNIPSEHLPRFIDLPSKAGYRDLIMIDDIVRHSITWLFPGYDVLDTYSIKLTRDAELYIDDEFSGNLVQKIKTSLQRRKIGPASRLVYDRTMPKKFLVYLQDTLNLENLDLLPEGRYHNNFDFFKFPNFGLQNLLNSELAPLQYLPFSQSDSVLDEIEKEDHLIHVPYHSYDPVIQFFEEAAHDPDVTHIKIIQYRVGNRSRIMDALMAAVRNGKRVSAFVEVKARFDEEANLGWGEVLSKAGVRVFYSWPGLKVHSKMAVVRKVRKGKPLLLTYFSTGNFNESTAEIYSDIGVFSADKRLTAEASRIFTLLETQRLPTREFKHLLVGLFNLRASLEQMIDFEISEAQAGREASIILKLNNLQDEEIIARLYQASAAGVKVKLIVRGICCLVPGVRKVSDNIEGISIVDRYLEHMRIFVFHGAGEQKMYMSSADWMTRNLSHRIETAVPIYDSKIKSVIMDILELQLNDNIKARILDKNLRNTYRTTDSDIPVQSQIETYFYFKRQNERYLKAKKIK